MTKTFSRASAFILFLLFSVSATAQTATPTPEQDDGDVVKISTNLIQVDATVTDKKGRVVTDLKPEDFEIYENEKKQDITNFSFIFSALENKPAERSNAPKTNGKNAIPLPPVKLRAGQVRRTYALVVDDLGLSFANSFWVKQSLKKFVNNQMQDGDLVAIFRVGGGIGALQSFTSDKRQLLAAVDKIRWNAQGRIDVDSYAAIKPDFREETQYATGKSITGIDQNKQSEIQAEVSRQANLGIGTLGALNYVIRGMRDLPGRKSLMFFSEGFQIFNYANSKPEQTRIVEGLKTLADIANRSSVVIYTLDPRGLEPIIGGGYTAEDDIRIKGGAEAAEKKRGIREDSLRDSKTTLRYLANQTGGIAYVDGNDLNFGIQKALDDQQGYYLIGYQPDSDTFDPNKNKYNDLTIKLLRPDLKIRYRSGFFGITDEKFQKVFQTPQKNLSAALTSPFGATGVNLDLYSVFVNDAQNKNFIRSFVRIDANDLKFSQQSNGFYKANVEILAMTFGDNGAPVEQSIKGYAIQFDEKTYRRVLQKGFVYDLSFPLKKAGAYQFRVAVRDVGTDKIGSASQFVDVPDIGKKKLTLSNLIVKNYSLDEWKKLAQGQVDNSDSNDKGVFLDTTSRQFKRGTMLSYGYIIYNAKTDAAQKPQLQVQLRLFRDGKLLLEGTPAPLVVNSRKDLQRIEISDAIRLGTDLQAGDYVLQLVVSDGLAKERRSVATQSIDFEVVK